MHAKDLTGNSMAHEAARRDQLDVLKLLKKANVALDEKNKLGVFIYFCAVEKGPFFFAHVI